MRRRCRKRDAGMERRANQKPNHDQTGQHESLAYSYVLQSQSSGLECFLGLRAIDSPPVCKAGNFIGSTAEKIFSGLCYGVH